MKHENLKKAVEKYAEVSQYTHGVSPAYTAEVSGYVISWYTGHWAPERADCVRIRRANDKDDWCSDYHAGSYYDTIKSAIAALTYNLNNERQ